MMVWRVELARERDRPRFWGWGGAWSIEPPVGRDRNAAQDDGLDSSKSPSPSIDRPLVGRVRGSTAAHEIFGSSLTRFGLAFTLKSFPVVAVSRLAQSPRASLMAAGRTGKEEAQGNLPLPRGRARGLAKALRNVGGRCLGAST